MALQPAFARDRVAVITGAASGIGLAAAERLARLGMKICMADIDAASLQRSAEKIAEFAPIRADVIAVPTDVSRIEDVERLKRRVYSSFGEVAFLMNNAGVEGGGGLFAQPSRWPKIIGANLWGVINGVQTFLPAMLEQGSDCVVVNTGSKQGITSPPGDTAYNVSKAGVKVVTEALAHELRNIQGCRITAHLLIPGFTFTGFTRVRTQEKPIGAWMPEQVIDFMLDAVAAGDFYILCPDNDVNRDIDALRIQWAADDIIKNRPALSRWHPSYKEPFAALVKGTMEKGNGHKR